MTKNMDKELCFGRHLSDIEEAGLLDSSMAMDNQSKSNRRANT